MTPTLVSVEEYLRSDYEPDRDYVDGVLEERNVGELDHSALQAHLTAWIVAHGWKQGIDVFTEQRTQITATRYRVPDLVLVTGKRKRGEGILTREPVAVIEILSPEDRIARMQSRIDDFLLIGARCVFLIDPATRRAWEHTRGGSREVLDGILRITDPAFEIPLPEIFAQMDERIED
jgi:Uma2 family endonuclease